MFLTRQVTKAFLFLAASLILCGTAQAQGFTGSATCSGESSPGNPYYCYRYDQVNSSGGNCTWLAWKYARENWGDPLGNFDPAVRVSWGNANNWANAARSRGYVVDSLPARHTIAVSNTLHSLGHVAWVESVDGDYVYVSEMYYNQPGVRWWQRYHKSVFNLGFIHPKPRPQVYSISPQPQWAWGDRDYWVSGANYDYNERVRMCWPGGGCSTLSGAQVPYSDPWNLQIRATIMTSGTWSLTAVNPDGRESLPYYFYVF